MIKNKEEKFKIILEYIKDLSIETPGATTLLYVRNNLEKYNMDIDISSLVLKNKSLEITTKIILQDKSDNIKYASVISIDSSVTDKNVISKIVLCDLQKIVYPKIEKIFLDLIKNAGYPKMSFDKKIDFEKLYNDKFN
jgi:preprotein translocase subunit SecB